MSAILCQARSERDHSPCTAGAMWLVQVGSRKADAQLSCARHLSGTCAAMIGGEMRNTASLTVTPAWRSG